MSLHGKVLRSSTSYQIGLEQNKTAISIACEELQLVTSQTLTAIQFQIPCPSSLSHLYQDGNCC